MQFLLFISFIFPAYAVELEWTYGEQSIVIAKDEVKNDSCEVASCGAYAYYKSLKDLESAIEQECKNRAFKAHTIVSTSRNTPKAKGLILTMTGICK